MTAPEPGLVRYGDASLSDLLPSVLASLGVAAEPNPLALDPCTSAVVLLVDGLGWNLLRAHPDQAPFLSGLAGRSLTAGFPTTTAASIASLGTGLPPGEHGLTSYTSRLPELSEPIGWLSWQGAYSGNNLLETVSPEQLQPRPTALQRAQAAGIEVCVVSARAFEGSGLTRAVLRGGRYVGVLTPAEMAAEVAVAAAGPQPNLTYCYLSELDLVGHGNGVGSDAWRVQLGLIDRTVELLAARLPHRTRLLITADHGMVDVLPQDTVDYDAEPALSHGVRLIAGEARARYLHADPADLARVRQTWLERLGPQFEVWTREQVIDAGWFGPTVSPQVRERIGDLIVLATGRGAIVRGRAEKRLSQLVGQHGSTTEDELLVPLLQR
ncbi:MAG TPA: nucleotide pyrophosphatase/phosphodiesterase family protein [Jatrophihabitans sp.]|nr:nucleotide pyrophosphatase/phosphodiesterase family protein [Jatrophihabitans sp.]